MLAWILMPCAHMRPIVMLGALVITALLVMGLVLLRNRQPEPDQVRMLPQDRDVAIHYVALGDSTVAGWGASSPETTYVGRLFAQLRTIYPQAHLTNLGAGGATSADVVRDQLPQAVALQPHLVTLSVGPNDITQGKDVEQYERHVETIFRTLVGQTRAVVVVNLLPDLAVAPRFTGEEKNAVGRRTVLFNEALARQAHRYGAQVVDLYGPSQQEAPDHPEFVAGDNYHPSDAGYARWAELMWLGVEARIAPVGVEAR